ncbi:MAG: hypothetical protein NT062_23105 [Proteobacteria bacterium]|nr:hypothetical protein [Pseudomonadota bacterium]
MKLLVALVCLLATTTAALADEPAKLPPTKDNLEARRAALVKKLDGQGFTVLVEAPFVVVGDEGPRMTAHRATGIMRWAIKLLEQDYFAKQPDKIIEVWLFANEKTYRKGAKKYFDDTPTTPYGYYSSAHDAMVMNIGPGAGTLTHELVHPYMEANFPNVPSWFNEGLASLYERPSEKANHIIGLPNWRLPNLKRELKAKTLPPMTTLLASTRDGFYEADYDAYAYARYLMQYLQEKGKLRAFYKAFLADKQDPTGQAALEAVLGEKLATFEPTWRAWALALQSDNR